MDVFDLRDRLVSDYQSYTRSFIKIRDARIKTFVDEALISAAFWPEPLLQLDPTFLPGGLIDDLIVQEILHSECARIFWIDKTDSNHIGKALVQNLHVEHTSLPSELGRPYDLQGDLAGQSFFGFNPPPRPKR